MKQYNGEKAIISMTSWSARIHTAGKTIYNLITMCPGFHIVLVLSEDEFPKKELPEDLVALQDYYELLWVKKNWKAFKKIVFTMDKYRDVPIISADDDCRYLINYAETLYQEWLKDTSKVVTFNGISYKDETVHVGGCYTLYPPYCFKEFGINYLDDYILSQIEDDKYYSVLKYKLHIATTVLPLGRANVVKFENSIRPLTAQYFSHSMHEAYLNMKKHLKL